MLAITAILEFMVLAMGHGLDWSERLCVDFGRKNILVISKKSNYSTKKVITDKKPEKVDGIKAICGLDILDHHQVNVVSSLMNCPGNQIPVFQGTVVDTDSIPISE
ncbi:hypothetical protein BGZ99_001268 [Dissophora globulifera]|uniref:Transposase n=1 Tax=Dissophora globulifera TaxID=979702 RepID=A0A9P6R2Z6_9FUNG|nr:hypothetical protein BGZ99_001268 [Dissophora globulifera]